VIKPDGNLTFNGKTYSLNAAQREQAQDYQASCAAACRGLMKARARGSKKAAGAG
jgi:hypothetical protein